MANKSSFPLQILIIDDDSEYVSDLQRDANPYRIILDHVTNLEDAEKRLELKGEKTFDGVILDVICLKDGKQKIPDPSFISKAKEVMDKKASSVPKVILTGETSIAETLKPYYEGTLPVYIKGSDDIDKMFAYFIDQNKTKEQRLIAAQYPEVFELFEKHYLDDFTKLEVVECLRNMNNNDRTVINNNLAGLRRIQEKIYISLNKIKPQLIPGDFFQGRKVDARGIMWHLTGRYDKSRGGITSTEYVPRGSTVDSFADLIYTVASNYGSHPSIDRSTKYTLRTLTFAMLDLLLWFKKTIEDESK